MKNESEVFLPDSSSAQKRRPHRSPPCLSSFLFNLFERSLLYACLVFLAFTFAIFVGTLTTYEEHREVSTEALYYTELTLFIFCAIEFVLRIYASEARVCYRGVKGKLRFFCEHYLFVDLILLIAYGIIFAVNWTEWINPPIYFLHALRFLQLFRFIPLDRHVKSIPLISSITWQYRRVLMAAVYLCFLLILPTAYLLWVVERAIETNGQYFFRTYTDSLWFTINSMATIGYGDTWPQTLLGRLITVTLCCLGLVVWTLPAGIIGAGLANIDEKYRAAERLRRPAARLIFAWWRLQTVDHQSRTKSGKNYEKTKCKQFIARLLFARLLREYRQCRNGDSHDSGTQMRKDIDQILRSLQQIARKIDTMDQKFLH